MKSFYNRLIKFSGIAVGLVAIFCVFKMANSSELKSALKSVELRWIVPVLALNFFVVIAKAFRWQMLVKPLSNIGLYKITKILMVGFMANNVLPARLGEAVRIQMLHQKTELSAATTTGGLIADKILEGLTFVIVAALLVVFGGVPRWMIYGLTITLLAIVVAYTIALVYSRSSITHSLFARLQDGIEPLHDGRVFIYGSLASMVSWLLQLSMIYMTQLAFGVELPFWGTLLVLVAVNLAVVVPSAPAHVGTFELACVLSYTFLGIDKNVGLLVGAAYHLVQVIPVTLVGALILLEEHVNPWRLFGAKARDEAGCR